jgi:hypothetical protein
MATVPPGGPTVGHEKQVPFSVGCGKEPLGHATQAFDARRTPTWSNSTTTSVAGSPQTQSAAVASNVALVPSHDTHTDSSQLKTWLEAVHEVQVP